MTDNMPIRRFTISSRLIDMVDVAEVLEMDEDTVHTLLTKLNDAGLVKYIPRSSGAWTKEELVYLEKTFDNPNITVAEIAKTLKRDRTEINKKAYELGLKRPVSSVERKNVVVNKKPKPERKKLSSNFWENI